MIVLCVDDDDVFRPYFIKVMLKATSKDNIKALKKKLHSY